MGRMEKQAIQSLLSRVENLEKQLVTQGSSIDVNADVLRTTAVVTNLLVQKMGITNGEVLTALTDSYQKLSADRGVQPAGAGANVSDSPNGDAGLPPAASVRSASGESANTSSVQASGPQEVTGQSHAFHGPAGNGTPNDSGT